MSSLAPFGTSEDLFFCKTKFLTKGGLLSKATFKMPYAQRWITENHTQDSDLWSSTVYRLILGIFAYLHALFPTRLILGIFAYLHFAHFITHD